MKELILSSRDIIEIFLAIMGVIIVIGAGVAHYLLAKEDDLVTKIFKNKKD